MNTATLLGGPFGQTTVSPAVQWLGRGIWAASVGLSAYHGVKRHRGWWLAGVGWGLLGAFFPVITPAVAFAQGFGKPVRS